MNPAPTPFTQAFSAMVGQIKNKNKKKKKFGGVAGPMDMDSTASIPARDSIAGNLTRMKTSNLGVTAKKYPYGTLAPVKATVYGKSGN